MEAGKYTVMVYPEQAEVHILEDEAASRAYIEQMWAEAMDIPNRAAVCRTVAFCSIMYCARRIVRSSGKPFTAVSLLPDEVSSVTVYVGSGTVRTHLYPFEGKRKRAAYCSASVCQKSIILIFTLRAIARIK